MGRDHTIKGIGRRIRLSVLIGVGVGYLAIVGSWLGVSICGFVSMFLWVGVSHREFAGFVYGAVVALVIGLFDTGLGTATFCLWFFIVMPTYE